MIRTLILLVAMLLSLSAWAGRPLPADAVPAHLPVRSVSAGSSSQPVLPTDAQADGDEHSIAALFILGMSLFLLLPVGIEAIAPCSITKAFGYRRALMQRRVQP
jgi:hypothetical protein